EVGDEPHPPAARLPFHGMLAARERLLDPPSVAHLADERVALLPDEQRALAAPVPERVRHQLVDGDDEVGPAPRVEAGTRRGLRDSAAYARERRRAQVELERLARRLRQRLAERPRDVLEVAIRRALPTARAVGQHRMRALRLLQHGRIEQPDVVRAEERPGGTARKREVEERLVAVALDELVGAPSGPDRLADAANRPVLAEMVPHEAAPRRDDARRVLPELAHVGVPDAFVLAGERLAQQLDLPRVDDDERRLAPLEPLAQEAGGAVDEVVVARIEEGLVPEALVCERGHRRTSRPRTRSQPSTRSIVTTASGGDSKTSFRSASASRPAASTRSRRPLTSTNVTSASWSSTSASPSIARRSGSTSVPRLVMSTHPDSRSLPAAARSTRSASLPSSEKTPRPCRSWSPIRSASR